MLQKLEPTALFRVVPELFRMIFFGDAKRALSVAQLLDEETFKRHAPTLIDSFNRGDLNKSDRKGVLNALEKLGGMRMLLDPRGSSGDVVDKIDVNQAPAASSKAASSKAKAAREAEAAMEVEADGGVAADAVRETNSPGQ